MVQTVNGRLGENAAPGGRDPGRAPSTAPATSTSRSTPAPSARSSRGWTASCTCPAAASSRPPPPPTPTCWSSTTCAGPGRPSRRSSSRRSPTSTSATSGCCPSRCPGGGFEWFGQRAGAQRPHRLRPARVRRHGEGRPRSTRRCSSAPATGSTPSRRATARWKPTAGGIAEGAINRYQGAGFRTTAYVAWALAASGDRDPRLEPRPRATSVQLVAGRRRPLHPGPGRRRACAAGGPRADARPLLDRLDGLKVTEEETVHWQSASARA